MSAEPFNISESLSKPAGLTDEQIVEINALSVSELDTRIKQAFKDGNEELSRYLHERKAEVKSDQRDQQKLKQALSNPDSKAGSAPAVSAAGESESTATTSTVELMGHAEDGKSLTMKTKDDDDTSDFQIVEVPAEQHKDLGDFVKSIIYGGLDGIITTFAIVTGVQGADLKPAVVLVLGFANLIADGISMGVGDYLSEKAEIDFAASERQRERWEFENFQQSEINEMVEIYQTKHGISEEDARLILDTMAKYPDFFIDHMMIQELGLEPPDSDANPALNGATTLVSFLCFGFVPLLSYLLFAPVKFKGFDPTFLVSICLTLTCLALLGAFKAKLTDSDLWRSIGFTVLNGGLAAGASWLIGFSLSLLTNVREH